MVTTRSGTTTDISQGYTIEDQRPTRYGRAISSRTMEVPPRDDRSDSSARNKRIHIDLDGGLHYNKYTYRARSAYYNNNARSNTNSRSSPLFDHNEKDTSSIIDILGLDDEHSKDRTDEEPHFDIDGTVRIPLTRSRTPLIQLMNHVGCFMEPTLVNVLESIKIRNTNG